MTPERRQSTNPRHEPLPFGRRRADLWQFFQRFSVLVGIAALFASAIGWVVPFTGNRVIGSQDDLRQLEAKSDRNFLALTATDSTHAARLDRIERVMELSSVLQCVRMPVDAPAWAQRQCDAIIAEIAETRPR